MIGWSSYLVSRVMVANVINVHYYERYVNLFYSWLVPWKTAAQVPETCAAQPVSSITWTANVGDSQPIHFSGAFVVEHRS
jgi:hypothetical protein